jgi:dTDP-4-amino-4,6-dideoxygalactose transaminase
MKAIPFVDLVAQHTTIQSEINAAIQQVLSQSNFILGSQVEEFEQASAASADGVGCWFRRRGDSACEYIYCYGVGR